MRTHPLHRHLILLLACLLAILLFVFGLAFSHVHFWGRYFLPIIVVFLWGSRSTWRRDIYIVAALAGVLVFATYWLGDARTPADLLVNHLLPTAILWGVAWLLAQRRELQDELEAQRKELLAQQQRLTAEVAARTAELEAGERRYRLLAENAGDLIWTVDMDGSFTYVSPSAQRVRGVTREEEKASSWSDRMPPEVAAKAAAAMQADLAALRAGLPIDATPHTAPAYRPDGTLMWSETVMSPLYDEDGNPLGLCGTTRDITARHQAEEALRQSQEQLAKIFRANPGGIAIIRRPDGCFLEANDAYLAIAGYTREQIIGHSAVELGIMPPATRAAFAASTLGEGYVRGVDLQIVDAHGRPVDVYFSIELIDYAGEPCFLLLVVDVTERKRLEATVTRLAAIVESSFDAIASTDMHGRVVSWNHSAEQLYGCSAAQAIGRPINELLRPGPATDEAAVVASVRSGATVPVADHVFTQANGTRVDLSIVLSPVRDKQGTVVGMASITRDITERKRAEQALRESQAHYQMLANHAGDVIWSMNLDGKVTYVSPSVLRQSGFTPEEAIGQTLEEAFTPASRAAVSAIVGDIDQLVRAGQPVPATPYLFEMLRKDGTTYWGESIYSVVYNEDGELQQLVGATRDVTRRVEAEHKLSEAYQRLQLATEAAGIGIWSWYFPNGQLEWDDRMCELHAVTPEERSRGISYDLWQKRIHPDDLELADPAQGDLTGIGGRWSGAYRIVLPSGAVRHIQSHALIEYDATGKPHRLVGINRDVTDQVAYDRLLQDTNAVLEQRVAERTADLQSALANLRRANQLKDEFMAMISHELRTPLTGVLTLAELLADGIGGPLNARQATYVNGITESGERLLAVVNGILSYTHLLGGQVHLEAAPCELNHLLAICAASQQHKAAAKGHSIAVHVDPPDLTLSVSATALAEVLKRLLDNAVKFTPEGGRIGLEAHPGVTLNTVDLAVWDTGIGIAPDQHENIFHAFTQADARLARTHEGIGLGLAYVDQMVRLMGGTIAVDSRPGEGSRFTVTLPA